MKNINLVTFNIEYWYVLFFLLFKRRFVNVEMRGQYIDDVAIAERFSEKHSINIIGRGTDLNVKTVALQDTVPLLGSQRAGIFQLAQDTESGLREFEQRVDRRIDVTARYFHNIAEIDKAHHDFVRQLILDDNPVVAAIFRPFDYCEISCILQ